MAQLRMKDHPLMGYPYRLVLIQLMAPSVTKPQTSNRTDKIGLSTTRQRHCVHLTPKNQALVLIRESLACLLTICHVGYEDV